jgi:hypothetical protein
MFDRHIIALPGRSETHHHTHVQMVDPSIEKGARFLNEVEKEAHARVVSALLLEVPGINVAAVKYECDLEPMMGRMRHRLAFKLNDQPIDLDLTTEDYDTPEAVVRKIMDHIAVELIKRAVIPMLATRKHLSFRA